MADNLSTHLNHKLENDSSYIDLVEKIRRFKGLLMGYGMLTLKQSLNGSNYAADTKAQESMKYKGEPVTVCMNTVQTEKEQLSRTTSSNGRRSCNLSLPAQSHYEMAKGVSMDLLNVSVDPASSVQTDMLHISRSRQNKMEQLNTDISKSVQEKYVQTDVNDLPNSSVCCEHCYHSSELDWPLQIVCPTCGSDNLQHRIACRDCNTRHKMRTKMSVECESGKNKLNEGKRKQITVSEFFRVLRRKHSFVNIVLARNQNRNPEETVRTKYPFVDKEEAARKASKSCFKSHLQFTSRNHKGEDSISCAHSRRDESDLIDKKTTDLKHFRQSACSRRCNRYGFQGYRRDSTKERSRRSMYKGKRFRKTSPEQSPGRKSRNVKETKKVQNNDLSHIFKNYLKKGCTNHTSTNIRSVVKLKDKPSESEKGMYTKCTLDKVKENSHAQKSIMSKSTACQNRDLMKHKRADSSKSSKIQSSVTLSRTTENMDVDCLTRNDESQISTVNDRFSRTTPRNAVNDTTQSLLSGDSKHELDFRKTYTCTFYSDKLCGATFHKGNLAGGDSSFSMRNAKNDRAYHKDSFESHRELHQQRRSVITAGEEPGNKTNMCMCPQNTDALTEDCMNEKLLFPKKEMKNDQQFYIEILHRLMALFGKERLSTSTEENMVSNDIDPIIFQNMGILASEIQLDKIDLLEKLEEFCEVKSPLSPLADTDMVYSESDETEKTGIAYNRYFVEGMKICLAQKETQGDSVIDFQSLNDVPEDFALVKHKMRLPLKTSDPKTNDSERYLESKSGANCESILSSKMSKGNLIILKDVNYDTNNSNGNKTDHGDESCEAEEIRSNTMLSFEHSFESLETSFEFDRLHSPIILNPSDRVYHISNTHNIESPDNMTQADGHDLDVSTILKQARQSNDILMSAMDSAGLCDRNIAEFMNSCSDMDSMFFDEDIINQLGNTEDADAFIDKIYAPNVTSSGLGDFPGEHLAEVDFYSHENNSILLSTLPNGNCGNSTRTLAIDSGTIFGDENHTSIPESSLNGIAISESEETVTLANKFPVNERQCNVVFESSSETDMQSLNFNTEFFMTQCNDPFLMTSSERNDCGWPSEPNTTYGCMREAFEETCSVQRPFLDYSQNPSKNTNQSTETQGKRKGMHNYESKRSQRTITNNLETQEPTENKETVINSDIARYALEDHCDGGALNIYKNDQNMIPITGKDEFLSKTPEEEESVSKNWEYAPSIFLQTFNSIIARKLEFNGGQRVKMRDRETEKINNKQRMKGKQSLGSSNAKKIRKTRTKLSSTVFKKTPLSVKDNRCIGIPRKRKSRLSGLKAETKRFLFSNDNATNHEMDIEDYPRTRSAKTLAGSSQIVGKQRKKRNQRHNSKVNLFPYSDDKTNPDTLSEENVSDVLLINKTNHRYCLRTTKTRSLPSKHSTYTKSTPTNTSYLGLGEDESNMRRFKEYDVAETSESTQTSIDNLLTESYVKPTQTALVESVVTLTDFRRPMMMLKRRLKSTSAKRVTSSDINIPTHSVSPTAMPTYKSLIDTNNNSDNLDDFLSDTSTSDCSSSTAEITTSKRDLLGKRLKLRYEELEQKYRRSYQKPASSCFKDSMPLTSFSKRDSKSSSGVTKNNTKKVRPNINGRCTQKSNKDFSQKAKSKTCLINFVTRIRGSYGDQFPVSNQSSKEKRYEMCTRFLHRHGVNFSEAHHISPHATENPYLLESDKNVGIILYDGNNASTNAFLGHNIGKGEIANDLQSDTSFITYKNMNGFGHNSSERNESRGRLANKMDCKTTSSSLDNMSEDTSSVTSLLSSTSISGTSSDASLESLRRIAMKQSTTSEIESQAFSANSKTKRLTRSSRKATRRDKLIGILNKFENIVSKSEEQLIQQSVKIMEDKVKETDLSPIDSQRDSTQNPEVDSLISFQETNIKEFIRPSLSSESSNETLRCEDGEGHLLSHEEEKANDGGDKLNTEQITPTNIDLSVQGDLEQQPSSDHLMPGMTETALSNPWLLGRDETCNSKWTFELPKLEGKRCSLSYDLSSRNGIAECEIKLPKITSNPESAMKSIVNNVEFLCLEDAKNHGARTDFETQTSDSSDVQSVNSGTPVHAQQHVQVRACETGGKYDISRIIHPDQVDNVSGNGEAQNDDVKSFGFGLSVIRSLNNLTSPPSSKYPWIDNNTPSSLSPIPEDPDEEKKL